MVENRINERGRRHWTRALNGLTVCATLALPIALASCSELLDVELPGAVIEGNLGPSTADVLALSVQGNVEYAWSSYVRFASHQSDEWNQQSKNADRNRAGLRQFDPSFNYYISGTYAPLHIALQESEEFSARIAEFSSTDVPRKDELIARIKGYGAWPLIALAEGFCASPVAGGEVLGAAKLFSMAEAKFTEALTLARAARLTQFENLALVGRARARLGRGDFAGAIADAQLVPQGFVFLLTRDDTPGRRQNQMYANLNGDLQTEKIGSIPGNYWDLKWKGVPDRRIQVLEHKGVLAYDFVSPHYRLANKHKSYGEDEELASWRAAQMTIADAAAQSGDLAKAREILNGFHTRAQLPGVTEADIPTQDDVIRHVIEERSREFFSEGGYRMFDHLRWRGTKFQIPFEGERGSFYPDGIDFHGERYGNTTCFPTPRSETPDGVSERMP